MSSKPLQVKDKVCYWQEDKSKVRSNGSKGGILLKGKVISLEGAMVGLDLGSSLLKVNVTKVRKDETIPPGKPGRSRRSCSRESSQDELAPLGEDNTSTWHALMISSMMIRNQTQR